MLYTVSESSIGCADLSKIIVLWHWRYFHQQSHFVQWYAEFTQTVSDQYHLRRNYKRKSFIKTIMRWFNYCVVVFAFLSTTVSFCTIVCRV